MRYTTGDIFKADAEALVNPVNCVGVMRKGLALQFENAYPDNFEAYRSACKRGAVVPGQMFIFKTGASTNPRYIINFPTKRHWRNKSRIEDVESGLQALAEDLISWGIRSVAVPPLGCGLGGLEWSEVRPRIESYLAHLTDVDVIIYEQWLAEATEKLPPI